MLCLVDSHRECRLCAAAASYIFLQLDAWSADADGVS